MISLLINPILTSVWVCVRERECVKFLLYLFSFLRFSTHSIFSFNISLPSFRSLKEWEIRRAILYYWNIIVSVMPIENVTELVLHSADLSHGLLFYNHCNVYFSKEHLFSIWFHILLEPFFWASLYSRNVLTAINNLTELVQKVLFIVFTGNTINNWRNPGWKTLF